MDAVAGLTASVGGRAPTMPAQAAAEGGFPPITTSARAVEGAEVTAGSRGPTGIATGGLARLGKAGRTGRRSGTSTRLGARARSRLRAGTLGHLAEAPFMRVEAREAAPEMVTQAN